MPGLACGTDPSKGRRTKETVRQIEVRMIEEIEELSPKLQVEFFHDLSILHQRQIDVLITRAIDNIPSCISKSTASRKDKSCSIEPSLRCLITEFGIPATLGRSFAPKPRIDLPVPLLSISESRATVNGRPDCNVTMPYVSQPVRSVVTQPESAKYFRPLPTGKI